MAKSQNIPGDQRPMIANRDGAPPRPGIFLLSVWERAGNAVCSYPTAPVSDGGGAWSAFEPTKSYCTTYVGGNGLCISTCKKPSSSIGWSRSLAPVDEP
jgi:hypothetical protein